MTSHTILEKPSLEARILVCFQQVQRKTALYKHWNIKQGSGSSVFFSFEDYPCLQRIFLPLFKDRKASFWETIETMSHRHQHNVMNKVCWFQTGKIDKPSIIWWCCFLAFKLTHHKDDSTYLLIHDFKSKQLWDHQCNGSHILSSNRHIQRMPRKVYTF